MIDTIKINDKTAKYILDTNAFYEYVSYLGVEVPGVGVNDRDDLDYSVFYTFIEKCLNEKSVFIPPFVFYEFVARFRDNKKTIHL